MRDIKIARSVESQAPRAANCSEDSRITCGIEFQNVATAGIRHVEVSIAVECQALGSAQARAGISEQGHVTRWVDFLYRVMDRRAYIKIAVTVEGQSARTAQSATYISSRENGAVSR